MSLRARVGRRRRIGWSVGVRLAGSLKSVVLVGLNQKVRHHQALNRRDTRVSEGYSSKWSNIPVLEIQHQGIESRRRHLGFFTSSFIFLIFSLHSR